MLAAEEIPRTATHRQPREKLAVAEFVTKHFAKYPHTFEPRLGIPMSTLGLESLNEVERRALEVKCRYCDALVELPDKTILIECKLYPKLGPLDGLLLYEELFKRDPYYSKRASLPVEKWFVYALEDPALNLVAKKLGIRTVEYRPEWLTDYMLTLRPRDRRAPRVL